MNAVRNQQCIHGKNHQYPGPYSSGFGQNNVSILELWSQNMGSEEKRNKLKMIISNQDDKEFCKKEQPCEYNQSQSRYCDQWENGRQQLRYRSQERRQRNYGPVDNQRAAWDKRFGNSGGYDIMPKEDQNCDDHLVKNRFCDQWRSQEGREWILKPGNCRRSSWDKRFGNSGGYDDMPKYNYGNNQEQLIEPKNHSWNEFRRLYGNVGGYDETPKVDQNCTDNQAKNYVWDQRESQDRREWIHKPRYYQRSNWDERFGNTGGYDITPMDNYSKNQEKRIESTNHSWNEIRRLYGNAGGYENEHPRQQLHCRRQEQRKWSHRPEDNQRSSWDERFGNTGGYDDMPRLNRWNNQEQWHERLVNKGISKAERQPKELFYSGEKPQNREQINAQSLHNPGLFSKYRTDDWKYRHNKENDKEEVLIRYDRMVEWIQNHLVSTDLEDSHTESSASSVVMQKIEADI